MDHLLRRPCAHSTMAIIALLITGACASDVGARAAGGDASLPSSSPSSSPSSPSPSSSVASAARPIAWQPWDAATFARARDAHRPILLTLVTTWCHWCHVMDEQTWSDSAIQRLFDERFVAIRIDADSRPDLASRYAEFGWPALVLLSPDAHDVTAWRGFRDARAFEHDLRAILADLDAGRPLAPPPPPPPPPGTLSLERLRDVVAAQLDARWDEARAGWGTPQKYPLWAAVQASLLDATLSGDARRRAQALATLHAEINLIDPVDGGMFQYSLNGVWTAPHFEKLAVINGPAMENFADAALLAGDARMLDAGRAIARYVLTTLRRDDGTFAANQDADVGTRGEHPHMPGTSWYALDTRAARAAHGEPFVDTHVFALHNGRLIAGLARLGAVSGDDALVDAAVAAADAVLALRDARPIAPGAFRHDLHGSDTDVHLADLVAMGHAFSVLADATGQTRFRRHAHDTARAILALLLDHDSGAFRERTPRADDVGAFARLRTPFQEGYEAARLLLHVGRLDDDNELVEVAKRAMIALASPDVVRQQGRDVGEALLALDEALVEPLHFAIVSASGEDDARATALRAAALRTPWLHRIVDVQAPGRYPADDGPTLYLCGAGFCSPPITDPAALAAKAPRFFKSPLPEAAAMSGTAPSP